LFGLSIAVADKVGAGVLSYSDWASWVIKKRETNKIEHVFAPNAHAKLRKVRIKCACWRKKVGKIYKNLQKLTKNDKN
jgi:hypothetical protein